MTCTRLDSWSVESWSVCSRSCAFSCPPSPNCPLFLSVPITPFTWTPHCALLGACDQQHFCADMWGQISLCYEACSVYCRILVSSD